MLGEILTTVLSLWHFVYKRDFTVLLVAFGLVVPLEFCGPRDVGCCDDYCQVNYSQLQLNFRPP
jgi:hypothetical protein